MRLIVHPDPGIALWSPLPEIRARAGSCAAGRPPSGTRSRFLVSRIVFVAVPRLSVLCFEVSLNVNAVFSEYMYVPLAIALSSRFGFDTARGGSVPPAARARARAAGARLASSQRRDRDGSRRARKL